LAKIRLICVLTVVAATNSRSAIGVRLSDRDERQHLGLALGQPLGLWPVRVAARDRAGA
jgi:hypothetical protein